MGSGNNRLPDCSDKGDFLTKDEKETLLTLARRAVQAVVKGQAGNLEALTDGVKLTPGLSKPMGAFVTLKKRGQLRGCIGYLQPIAPLFRAVLSNAANAAVRDTRFHPVQPEELSDIHIEISVLSVPVDVSSAEDIKIGCHGIILEKEGRRATFLPHVATEQGWSREETLDHLTRKAGLPRRAWLEGTSFQVYTALVFEEKKGEGR